MPEGEGTQVTSDAEGFAPAIEQTAFEQSFAESTSVTPGEGETGDAGKPPETDTTGQAAGEVTPPETEKKETTTADVSGSQPDYKALLEAEQQRTRSWEGRLKKADDTIKVLEEKVNKISQAPPQTPSPSQPAASAPARRLILNEEDAKSIDKFSKEMGDEFMKPFDAVMRRTILEFARPLAVRVIELEKQLTATSQTATHASASVEDAHYAAILEAFPDSPEIVDKDQPQNIYKWIEDLPMKEAVQAQAILQKGNAKKVIELFGKYKESIGKPKTPETPNPGKKTAPPSAETLRRAEAATAVKSGGSFIPKTKADKNDFEGAFAEATTEHK